MLKTAVPVGKAVIQIRVGSGKALDKIRINGQHNAFVHTVVDLGQLMAFVLIDNEQISRGDGIKAVVDQKLLSARNGIVQLITVMNMHFHGFFFFIEVGNGKGSGALTVFNCSFAGIDFFHNLAAPFNNPIIQQMFNICKVLRNI